MCKYSFILIILISQSLWAKEPDWISKLNFEDSTTYYFVESSAVENLNQPYAREELRQQATKEAIRKVIGTESQLITNTVSTERNEQVSTTNNELFPQIELKNFSEDEVYRKDDTVFVLYAWAKSDAALAIEKAKIAKKISKNEIYTNVSPNTQITITSEPAGAEVFIDDLRWGTTPLALNKKINFGAHKFVLKHKLSQTLEFEEVIFDSEKQIHRVLPPLEAKTYKAVIPQSAVI